MRVAELKELLDDYGDHLEVYIADEDEDAVFEISVESGPFSGTPAVFIVKGDRTEEE